MGIKISEVIEKKDELIRSLRGVESPGKRKLLQNIKDEDYLSAIKELLYRIELYSSVGVLRYTRQVLNSTVLTIKKYGVDAVANKLYNKILEDQLYTIMQEHFNK